MTTNARRRHESIGTPDRIATRRLLGIDAEGREHRWDMVARTLYVLDDGDVAHAEDVGDRSLGDWVAYIETHVGWDGEPNYAESPFDTIEVRG